MTDCRSPRVTLTLATVLLCVSAAPDAHAEWMLTGYLGATHTQAASLTIVQPALNTDVTLASVDYRGESFTSPLYYGYRVTWFPRSGSWFGLDAEFIHQKAHAETDHRTNASGRIRGVSIDEPVAIRTVLERFSISHGLNLLLFNAVARHAIGSSGTPSRVTLAGRIGAGPTIPHAESTIDGQSREGYAWGALGWQAAAGVQVRLTRHLDLAGEYKFTRTSQSVDIEQGRADGVFTSHHGVFGLCWRITGEK